MFKKPIALAPQHPLSTQDRKRLLGRLACAAEEDAVERLDKDWPLVFLNKVTKSKMIVYTRSEEPMLFAEDAVTNPLPSLLALTRIPGLLRRRVQLKPGVEIFLARGANLMWPGVISVVPSGKLTCGEVVAVVTSAGDVCGVAKSAEDVDAETKIDGIAFEMLHHAWDSLSSLFPPSTPSSAASLIPNTLSTNLPPASDVMTAAEMDVELREALLNTLCLGPLPTGFIESAKLWRDHILPHRRPDTALNLSQSSFKKLSEFLKTMQAEGLLVYREAEKGKPAGVVHLRCDAPQVKAHCPTAIPPEPSLVDNGAPLCTLEVKNWMKPPAHVVEALGLVSELLTRAELCEAAKVFLKKNKALHGKMIRPSPAVEKLLPKIALPLSVDEFCAAVEASCETCHTLIPRETGCVSLQPRHYSSLRVVCEKKAGHYITRIAGLKALGTDFPALLTALRKLFDTGGSLQAGESKSVGPELVLQGRFGVALQHALAQRLGIGEDVALVVDKTSPKA